MIAVSAAMKVPLEILQQICHTLDQPELKSMRIVCRSCNDASTTELFRQISLKPNIDSFSKLHLIAAHPVYSKIVKVLTYNGSKLSNCTESCPDQQQWYQRIGPGIRKRHPRAVIDDFKRSFAADRLSRHYKNFCKHYQSEKFMETYNLEHTYLVIALDRLPKLEEIQFDCGGPYTGHRIKDSNVSVLWESLSTIGRETLVEPDDYGSDEHFGTLLCAVNRVRKRPAIVQGHNLAWEAFDRSKEVSGDMIEIMAKCQHLSLSFDAVDTINSRALVARMIAGAPFLQTLDISFGHLPSEEGIYVIGLSQLIQFRCHWPQLKRLELSGLCSTDKALREFISSHASTLRVLELGDILLIEDEELPGNHRGAWVSMILFLRQTLSLQKVRLDGYLQASSSEAWCIHDPDLDGYWTDGRPPPPVGSCVKHRVERFVIEGGELPLPRGDFDYFEGDDSWTYCWQMQHR